MICRRHKEVMRFRERSETESERRHEEVMRRLDREEEESRRRHEEFLRRQGKRDEEAKAYAEEVRAYAEEVRAYVEESRVAREEMHRESEARVGELRAFNREILLRNEKVYTALIAEIEEGRKQIQANTKAVLSVLDRLGGPGGLAA